MGAWPVRRYPTTALWDTAPCGLPVDPRPQATIASVGWAMGHRRLMH
jgi:hypothetical protein